MSDCGTKMKTTLKCWNRKSIAFKIFSNTLLSFKNITGEKKSSK